MRSRVRILLAFVLALAIPLQGFAAASMLLCGPGHDRRSVSFTAPHHGHADAATQHEHAVHSHAQGHGGGQQHAHTTDSAQASTVDASTAHDGGKATAKLLSGKCSLCASCCSGLALLGAPGPVAITATHAAPVVEPAPILIGIVPPRLERPPRT